MDIEKMKKVMNEFTQVPRRNQMLAWCPAEKAVSEAVQEVERMGADVLLTDAVVLLSKAQDKIADYVDKQIAQTQ